MSPHHADHLRGMTVFADNRTAWERLPEFPDPPLPGSTPFELVKEVELCPGARIYSLTISVRTVAPDNNADIPDVLARLHLQDSIIEVPSYGCAIAEIRADLPAGRRDGEGDDGIAWPAFARLVAPQYSFVTLHLFYGHCT